MDVDFKTLVKSAKKGNRHSFAVLYSQIYKELYRYALFTLRNQQDAEDCVSEAVIDAYRKGKGVKGNFTRGLYYREVE